MKKILLLSSFIFICSQVFSQISAITNSGDSVILNSDGTWKYKNKGTTNPKSNKPVEIEKTTATNYETSSVL